MVLRHRTSAEPEKPVLKELAATTAELKRVEQHQRELVAQARFEGCSWEQVAAATGVSHHAARKRWHVPPPGATSAERLEDQMLAEWRPPAGPPPSPFQ
jgi:hypothetical protein